ncbi:hypothetical protein B0O99DRAFT_619134 [Bisporella sp. PMI_857]|nr:hypothetical protein B0O99DRAFT_619134 [Bisporella sp. PMI_857]
MLEFEIHQFQNIKTGLHVAQALFIFVSWAIEIAVLKDGKSKIDGRPGWHFGLCFLTIPAIIYLAMTPRFPRTRKFANPYAMATVDGVFCIFWLSAFAAVANWNAAGKCGGACNLSKAVVGLGVFIWLLWIGSTFMSLYAVFYYKREGYLPGASRAPTNANMIDPDKDAFSTAPHDDEYAPVHNDDHEIPIHSMNGPLDSHSYNQSSHTYQGPSDIGAGNAYDPPQYGGAYAPPSVGEDTSYSGYNDTSYGRQQAPVVGDNGRVHFPDGRYDNVPVLGDRH